MKAQKSFAPASTSFEAFGGLFRPVAFRVPGLLPCRLFGVACFPGDDVFDWAVRFPGFRFLDTFVGFAFAPQ